ncbi:MAG: TatD family hydrolase [Bdellovibrionales bacterium]|nr:TatD family hydrolase [Bdellovibrionales bacterium]
MRGWVDAHAHWAQAFPARSDTAALEKQMVSLQHQGMSLTIQGGVDPEDWTRQLALYQMYPLWIRPVLGLHPWWVKEHTHEQCKEALAQLEKFFGDHSEVVVALGELGVDFSKNGRATEELQLFVFQQQLELASRFQKPLILHLVHGHEVALRLLLKHSERQPLRGLVHAFSGSFEVARQYVSLGLKLSIGPGISEPGRFLALKKALPQLSPADWVLESDGAGEQFFRVVQAVSGLTGRPPAEISEQTRLNLQEVGLLGA